MQKNLFHVIKPGFIKSCFKGSRKACLQQYCGVLNQFHICLPVGAFTWPLFLQQLLVFFNIILTSQRDVIYLDFRTDFDSVAQNELLFKLWKFRITGNIWFWLRAYLVNQSSVRVYILVNLLPKFTCCSQCATK